MDPVKSLRKLATKLLKTSSNISNFKQTDSSGIASFLEEIRPLIPRCEIVVADGSFSGKILRRSAPLKETIDYLKYLEETETDPKFGIDFFASDAKGEGNKAEEFTWEEGLAFEKELEAAAANLDSTPFKDNPVTKYVTRMYINVDSPETSARARDTARAVYPPAPPGAYRGD